MAKTADAAALNNWYAVGRLDDFALGIGHPSRLLGQEIQVTRSGAESFEVRETDGFALGPRLPVQLRYGHVWTTLGAPERDILDMPEFLEPDRRLATCGPVRVRTSGLRVVENFLDLAHFPFVHTNILGIEDKPEVTQYAVEHRAEVDEIWATKCEFFQPLAAKAAKGGQITHYMYRVSNPFVIVLYKTSPGAPERWDVIGLFVQPLEADECIAHSFVLIIDDSSSNTDLIHFQQTIFVQDRVILENQRPRLLPLDARLEIPGRADLGSVAYRRWLKAKGLGFGTLEHAAA